MPSSIAFHGEIIFFSGDLRSTWEIKYSAGRFAETTAELKDEHREIIIGYSTLTRLLLVCFVERDEDTIRLISARRATKAELKDYEKNARKKTRKVDDLAAEYRFDYSKAKPNRFASHMKDSPLVAVIDPDVAKVFTTAEAVNKALRALISAMPTK